MTRHGGLVLFSATLALTLPAAWRSTDALRPDDGPAARPWVGTLVAGDVTVSASLAASDLSADEEAVVTLVASARTRKEIAVEVDLSQPGRPEMARGRVAAPPS